MIGATSIGPEEAASNLSKWMHWFGINDPPGWLVDKATDHYAILGAIAFAVIYSVGVFIVPLFVRDRHCPSKTRKWATALNGWQVATGVFGSIVLARLVLAPYWIFKRQSDGIDRIKEQISNPIPDVIIDIRGPTLILPQSNGRVLIIITDVHITNRSTFSVSLEIVVRFNLDGALLYPTQNEMAPLFLKERRSEIPSLGEHFPVRIALGPQEGRHGYLSYGLAQTIFAANTLTKANKELELLEHVSGTRRVVSLASGGSGFCWFRDCAGGLDPRQRLWGARATRDRI